MSCLPLSTAYQTINNLVTIEGVTEGTTRQLTYGDGILDNIRVYTEGNENKTVRYGNGTGIVKDCYILDTNPDSSYCGAGYLRQAFNQTGTWGWDYRNTLIKIQHNISAVDTINSAILYLDYHLDALESGESINITFGFSLDQDWDAVTWNNKPTLNNSQEFFETYNEHQDNGYADMYWQVTKIVNKTISEGYKNITLIGLAIAGSGSPGGNDYVNWRSTEATLGNTPYLEVNYTTGHVNLAEEDYEIDQAGLLTISSDQYEGKIIYVNYTYVINDKSGFKSETKNIQPRDNLKSLWEYKWIMAVGVIILLIIYKEVGK